MKKILILLLIFILSTIAFAQHLFRQPAINHDGTMVAFTFQGDIWIVPTSGGEAKRITVHEAYETNPKFAYDDSKIFFSSNRYGNNDLFAIDLKGGGIKRLTYHSANDNISNIVNEKEILFTTSRENQQIERLPEIYAISTNGGTEYKKLSALGFDPSESPDGRFIAFTRGSNAITREAYVGSANKNIWLFDSKTNKYLQLDLSNKNDYMPQWLNDRTLIYLSAENGKYNLFQVKIDDSGNKISKQEQLTNVTDFAIRNFSISRDKSTIVFEQGLDIFIMKFNSKPQKLNINLPLDYKIYPEKNETFSKDAEEYNVSPNGKLIAFNVHGEIFIKEIDKDKSRSVNISNSSFRDVEPVWLNDSTLIFSSDRDNKNYDLYLVRSTDSKQRDLFKSLKREVIRITNTSEDESSPVVSNDKKKIAFLRGNGKLIVADISKDGQLSNEKKLLDGWATPGAISWSPDDKFVAYSLEDLYFNEEIYIHPIDNTIKPVNISMHPRSDSNPVWSPDGKKLFFLSTRDSRNGVGGGLSRFNDVWFVWLTKEDWQKTKEDWEDFEKPKEESNSKKTAKKKDSLAVNVKIDFDKMYERLVQVTNFPANESNVQISKDGELIYFIGANSDSKGNDIYSIKWNGKDLKELTKGGSNPSQLKLDSDRKYAYYFKNSGSLNRLELKGEKSEALPYVAKFKIDYQIEKEQIFEEAWRALNNLFYDPKFHGRDWEKLHDFYKPLCLAASTPADFKEIFNYMLGELNSSHMGMFGDENIELQKEVTAQLGTELESIKNGMKILRIIPNTPADRVESKLSVNEIITEVDGNKINDAINFYSLLNHKENSRILLKVKSNEGNEREVVIRPVDNIRQNLYEEWVENRKKLTEKYSGGKLGYIHIQGMNMQSFEKFERELAAAGNGKDGLIIDVRFNGGGSTTDYLMSILNYKQHAYTIPRGAAKDLEKEKKNFRDFYPTGERLVYSAWMKPSISICNQDSYSNAEIYSHAYKQIGLGTLVGTPTNGSVISTGGKSLIDGSFVRTPFRGWFVKATDKNEELGPAIPDILVDENPDKSYLDDDQLKKAVDKLLSELKTQK